MTTTLEKAMRSLRSLPADVQDELGERLLRYASGWHELKAGIEQGTAELRRGEGIEITDVDGFVDNLSEQHGRS